MIEALVTINFLREKIPQFNEHMTRHGSAGGTIWEHTPFPLNFQTRPISNLGRKLLALTLTPDVSKAKFHTIRTFRLGLGCLARVVTRTARLLLPQAAHSQADISRPAAQGTHWTY